VNFTVSSGAALTLATSPATPDAFDNVMALVQKVNLTVNDGKQPRSVVDISGSGLLEYQLRSGGSLDRGTATVAAYSSLGTLPVGNYTVVYKIPFVDDRIGEPLRTRCYLPVHLYPQDPVLTLQFQNAANMYSAGNINFVGLEVQLIRRQVTAASEMVLQKTAGTNPSGYIDSDLIETAFNPPVGSSAEYRMALPIPGQYGGLMLRHYLGGSSVTRAEIDSGASGSAFGSENRWRLETGSVVIREFRWKHLRADAEMSAYTPGLLAPSQFVAATSGAAVNTAMKSNVLGVPGSQVLPASQGFFYANSCYLNFLTDGSSGDVATELGSLLDCNTPANSGLKMELIGSPTSVATNASTLFVAGRRFFGDLRRWQAYA
jgi:hypothetical protein